MKSSLRNKRNSIIKKLRVFLKNFGVDPSGMKYNAMIIAFLKIKGYEEVKDKSALSSVLEVFESGSDIDLQKYDAGFYLSEKWRSLRKDVFATYGFKCMKCGSDKSPCVDHIKPRSLYPLLELDFDNMQVLCRPCNSSKSNKSDIDYRQVRLRFAQTSINRI